jgi:NAD+ synthase (glutamine-hydrolysing)
LRVGLAQIDARVGDLAGNAGRVLAAARAAAEQGAEVVVFPELCLTGFPPRDLLLDDAFVSASIDALERVARALDRDDSPPVVLGAVARSPLRTPGHPGLYNALFVLRGGRAVASVAKRLLPAYDVFHDTRWFVPGPPAEPVEIAGRKLGLCICEDIWSEGYPADPPRELRAAGADILVCSSASPYRVGVLAKRLYHARRAGGPLVYVNAAGAQDELIFDGGSFAIGASGDVIAELPRFEEAVAVVDMSVEVPPEADTDKPSPPEEMFRALALGVRGFARKNGVRRVFLGLSGGVDSAVVASIAAEALGPSAVTAIAMPSRHTDPRSTIEARSLAEALGVGFEVAPIEPLHAAFEASLAPLLAGAPAGDTTLENVQARIRAIILMSYVNRFGGALLNTSNKTELSLGYGTLYGDLAGALCVIGDVIKTEVVAMARWVNREAEVIPRFILERPPSAELRPDQVDPFDYDVVAPIVEAIVAGAPVPSGKAPDVEIARLRRLIRGAEHKRWQSGIALKVSERAFGSGRLIPVTRAATE